MSEVDVKENLEVLVDASRGAWDIDADELLLTTLSALQEKFLERLNDVRKDVDGLSEDVRKATSEFQNTVNDFIQLSQNQFVENRCAMEDDVKSDTSESSSESELDEQEKAKKVYTDAVMTCVTTLEKRSIPLFESDDEDDDGSEDGSEGGDSSDEGVPNARDHYRRRPLLALIGSFEFLSDPHCGLGGDPYMAESSEDDSSDSEAEPIAFTRAIPTVAPVYTQPTVAVPVSTPSAPAPPVSAPTSQPPSKPVTIPGLRERVLRFYEVYNPAKLSDVDTILSSFAGREDKLIPALIKRYGPEPGANDVPRPPAKKAFGNDGSDSDRDAAPRAPEPKKAPPKKVSRALVSSSDSDSDAAPKPAAKKAPPQKKASKTVATNSDSDSDGDAPARPAPPAKKAPPKKAISTDSDSDSDAAPKPAAKKAPPKPAAKQSAVSSDSDGDAPSRPAPPAKKAPPKKAISTDSDSDSDAAPKPAAKKAPPLPPRKMPVPKALGTDSDSDAPAVVAKRPMAVRPKVKPAKTAIYSDSD